MGNAFSCSCFPCPEQNDISKEIRRELESLQSMEHVEELIVYIDRVLRNIERGGQENIRRPTSVGSLINSGGNLIEKLSRRLHCHVCKRCLLSALDRQTRQVVFGVLNQGQHILYVGVTISIIAHLLERIEQVSSNTDQCLHLLRYMSTLVKHMKNLDIHLSRSKLNDILGFIVKGTLMCALLIQPNSVCRFISSPLDDADMQNLESQLVHVYHDLEFEALTALLDRLPIVPSPSQGEYPRDAVGLEKAQNEVTKLLDLTESSLKIVVIYGVGGIGKTTLATAVFKSLDLSDYHYCRIDMDKECKFSDLQAMQEQILRNLFNKNLKLNNCTHGQEKLSEAFGKASKPVFLFMDNALRHTDVEMLLPMQHLSGLPIGSRILLTTRSLDETKIFRLQQGIQFHSHRVDPLTDLEAKRLLCHYALGDKDGSFDPGVNMDGLVQICGGIPLFLKIVGSKMRTDGNTVSACNEILDYVKEWQRTGLEGGDEDLSERLVDFVYRRLTEPSKEAFLDIAFFFYDWERSKVGEIVGEMQLRDLEGAALVTTLEEDEVEMDYMVKKTKVKMHDIVKARGKKLSEGNRITDLESLSILLSDAQKLQQIKGIWLRNPYELRLEAKHVDLMSKSVRILSFGYRTRLMGQCERAFEKLRYLHINYEDMLPIHLRKSRQLVCFHGHLMKGHRFPELPRSLRLLYFHASNSPVALYINGHHTSLRELQLSNITLTNFEKSISQLKNLRSLQLDRCEGFTSFPESFGNLSCLEILTLFHYSMLERFPESLGNLSSLQRLNISGCSNLKRLPDSFGNLSSLQVLHMGDCSMLTRLPDSFGNLSSLRDLHMVDCSMLEKLPESFGNLSSLQRLNISGCSNLEELPDSFGNLSSLQDLHMGDCSMLTRLPDRFVYLSSLQDLHMVDCSMLEKLPESFGNLSSLRRLDISGGLKLERLPESFGSLSSLQYLDTCACSMLERLPESFGNLFSMKALTMRSCSNLERLPERFGNLSSMKDLTLCSCSKLEKLPESFGNLISLQDLDIVDCFMLKRLPESFGNLSSLEGLDISGCSKLERLPESFENLSSLERLYIPGCSNLKRLPESFGNLFSLQKLDIAGCSKLERFPESFGNLSSLQVLRMRKCSKLKRFPQTFEQLRCLQTLEMDGCEKMCGLSDNFGQLKCLKFLSVSDCKELKRLPDDIVLLVSLVAMAAYGCAELEAKAMDSLVEIKSLMFLEMGESPLLIKRWEQIQQHRPLIGAALRFERGNYPYEEIMSTMIFSGGSRILHVDGEGQLAEAASSSFLDVGAKVGLLFAACHLSNEVRDKLLEVASPEFQIIYVDVEVEGEAEGSRWMEERDKRIRKALLQLPEGSGAWTSPFFKNSLLFAYSLWHFTERADTSVVVTSVVVDEEGRRKLSQPETIFQTGGLDSCRRDLRTLFSPLLEASEWMVQQRYFI